MTSIPYRSTDFDELIQGLDWHGPSAQDAWASVDALVTIVDNNKSWHSWSLVKDTPVVLIGHSNGGQGAWYMAARYPDRVLACKFFAVFPDPQNKFAFAIVVPAAGYIKSQSYVPLTMSRWVCLKCDNLRRYNGYAQGRDISLTRLYVQFSTLLSHQTITTYLCQI
jgi:pimeloyl-ACP methyl ester carboxylesterase